MTKTTEELNELMDNRAKLYSFFSRMYCEEADAELLENWKTILKPSAVEDKEMARHCEELQTFLEGVNMTQEFIDDLAADYAALFLGIGRHPAHPYESVYLSKDKIVMREPWVAIVKLYREHGLQKTADYKEPEDHIAMELEFMAYLCLKVKEELNSDDKASVPILIEPQKTFLQSHLNAWAPMFCTDIVSGSAKYDFYRIVAHLTQRFLELDQETLAALTT